MCEMSEEAKELARAYKREWQRKNKDKVKLYKKRYWEKKLKEKQEQEQKNTK